MNSLDKNSIEILARNFDLETMNDFKLFREALIQRLNYLVNHDFEKLLWILYRIDVREQLVKDVLADKENLNPAETLADLIIERQLQKAETRLKYKDKGETDGELN
jgi:hypothetical protein